MTTLNSLPSETLTQILSGLSNADLAHISLLSSRLCAIAEPLLYTAPDLSERERPSLSMFLRTLLLPGRESLTTRVTSLRVHWYGVLCEQDSLDTAGLPHSPQSDATELTFLLRLLPSLRSLKIVFVAAPSDSTHLLESHDTQPSALPLALRSLRQLYYYFLDPCGARAGMISTPPRLPLIHPILTPIDQADGLSMLVPYDTAGLSSITKLRLSNETPIPLLRPLLKDLTALTHFSYTAYVWDDFDIYESMRALEPLRNSLQYLHLDFPTEREPDIYNDPMFIGVSLRTLPVLQTLICGLMPLLGKQVHNAALRLADVLPPSLRELQILKDHYWTYVEAISQAVELMDLMETVVPKLKSLVVVQCWDNDWQLEQRLALLCTDTGVMYDAEDSFTLER